MPVTADTRGLLTACAIGTAIGALLAGTALALSQSTQSTQAQRHGTFTDSLSTTGDREWLPGSYLDLYTRPAASAGEDTTADYVAAQRWDPGRYLENYTAAWPDMTIPQADLRSVPAGDWEPGQYLQLYTQR